MKYCSHCGAELTDDAVICLKCGCPAQAPTATVATQPKLNTLALVGFIFSLVSGTVSLLMLMASDSSSGAFVIGLPFAIAGLVCSIIGLVKTRRNNERGKGFAITGIVVSAVVCALWIIILLISLYFLALVYLFLFLIIAVI